MGNIFYSTIIVAKNESKNITKCLESIRGIKSLGGCSEIILVDNGSMDGTVDLALKQGVAVYVEPSLTVSGMRNFGAQRARGDILIFLDADVVINEEWVSSLTIHLIDDCFDCAFAPESWVVSPTFLEEAWLRLKGLGDLSVRQVKWCQSGAFMIKREAFESIGGFNTSLKSSEDYDFGVRLSSSGKIIRDGTVSFGHIRTPKTIRDLFWQQVWHGNGAYRGFRNQEFKFTECLGTFLPNIFMLSIVLLFVCFILNLRGSEFFLLVALTIYLTYVFRKVKDLDRFFMMKLFLVFLFLVARGVSILVPGRRLC